MTPYNIPFNLVNDIIMMSIQKPLFVSHLDRISDIVSFKERKGFGDYRIIDYLRNVYFRHKIKRLNTHRHNVLVYHLNQLIESYELFKRMRCYEDNFIRLALFYSDLSDPPPHPYDASSNDEYSSDDD